MQKEKKKKNTKYYYSADQLSLAKYFLYVPLLLNLSETVYLQYLEIRIFNIYFAGCISIFKALLIEVIDLEK